MKYFEDLTKEQLHNILEDVGTDEESMKRDVNNLMIWMEKTVYLPPVTDDVFLSSALLRCKNRMEKVKQFLDYYYSRRTLAVDMFLCRDPHAKEIQNSRKLVSSVPFPKLTPEGYRIQVCSFRDYSSKNLPQASSILSMWQMEQEVLMKSEKSKGIICIIDAKHFNVSVAALFLANIKKFFDFVTKTTKARYCETYILNLLPAGQLFYDSTKQILSGKMMGRIHIWNKKPAELAEVLPKSSLPTDFGGEEKSLDELRDMWYEYVGQFKDWFKSEESVKADMSKRPKDDSISQEFQLFGLTGSFRRINLD